MKNHVFRVIALAGFALVLLIGLYVTSSARRELVQADSGHRIVMGTFARVVVLARNEAVAQECIAAAFKQQRRVDDLMSDYKDDSELSQVNREAFHEPVQVSEATFTVLEKAKEYSELSGGAFDVTIGPLSDLWRSAGENNVSPSEAQITEARSKVGYEKLLLDPQTRTVRFAVEGMRLDLGGIAKGYAIDLSVQAMKQHGAVGGMVDIGGDVMCFGTPPEGKETWVVGLQDPTVAPDDLAANRLLLALRVMDAAVTTSGDYRRFTRIQGKKESHIMDRRSGHGANQLVSVTIIAPDALSADALATAVTVLGQERGLALIERLPNTEAIVVPHASEIQPVFSSGAEAYVK